MPAKRRAFDLETDARQLLEPTTEKEKAIVEAAIVLIGERGIDGATTAEIAKRAKVTERTLFRYFPSKKDLVRRVLLPLLMRGGIAQQWEALERLIKTKGPDLKSWYVAAAKARFEQVSKNPTRTKTVMAELLQNDELRNAMTAMWQKHIWQPMTAHLKELQVAGEIRKEVDVETMARMVHYLQAGHFLTRFVFAPKLKLNDAGEIEKMGEILMHGASRRKA